MKRMMHYVICMLAGLIIATTPVSAASAITEPPGLIVEEIIADSSAAKAGLKVGDKLLTFDDRALTSLATLRAIQQNVVGKKDVVLRVQRGQEVLTFRVPIKGLGMYVRPELSEVALQLYRRATQAQKAEKAAEAISLWIMAAKETEREGNKNAASWLYFSAGLIYEGQENCKEAQEIYAQALKTIEGSQDTAARVIVMESLGWCKQNLKNYTAGQELYKQAFEMNTAAGYEVWAAGDLSYLGRIALSTQDYQTAQGFFDRALKIYERSTPGSGDVASSLALLGDVAYFTSDFKAAQDYFERALKIYEKLEPESENFARNLDSLGSVVYRRGDLDAAEGYYRRSLEIRQRLDPNSLNVTSSLNNLGNVAYLRGDLFAAQDYYRRASEINKLIAPGSLEFAASENNLGNVLYSANNLSAAQDYYNRALKIYEKLDPGSLDAALSLNNLGNVAYQRKDLGSAEDYHRRSLEIRQRLAPNSLEVADSLGNLGSISYLRGDLNAAEDFHRRALKIREQLAPGSLGFATSLANLGQTVFKRGRLPEALQLFKDSVNIIEAHRGIISSIEARAFLTARYIYAYTGLLQTNLALKDLPSAFAVVERARARSFIELLGEGRIKLHGKVNADLLRQQIELDRERSTTYATLKDISVKLNRARLELSTITSGDAERVKKLNAQIKELGDNLETHRRNLIGISVKQRELTTKIRRDSSKSASLTYPEPLDLKGVQAALDADTLLLSYFVGVEETYLFAVTKNSIKVFTLPTGEDSLKEQVKTFRNEVASKRVDLSNWVKEGKSLYDILIGPAQDSINQAKRILICPDGPLNILPFAALVRQPPPTPRYFIEDKPLHMINSMTVYAKTLELRTENGQQMRLLAFGNPVNNLTALKSAQTEVQKIGRLFGQSATLRLGPQATETSAKDESRNYSILHFAVHGQLDTDVGLNSSLALSQPEMAGMKASEKDNGFLQAWEIFEQIRLKADLVVLSACETGPGENVRGEGLIGLTRAFQYAGTKSIVVSLWEVDDESTATFMTTFYQELRKGVNKDVALQTAMNTVRSNRKWQHPFHWSPFILVGDWR
jgi:CHAT domain-containing protein/Tfp pilus assembly protein PilF